MRIQHGLLILLVGALLFAPAAMAKVARTDSSAVSDPASMQYHSVLTYSNPNDPTSQRRPYDFDSSNSNSANETAAYEANATATRLGYATSTLRWDNLPTYWVDLSATTAGFDGGGMNSAFSLILDGTVNLTSAAGLNHTLTISNLSTYTSYSFALSLPNNWSVVSSTGVNVSIQTQNSIEGTVDPTGFAVIQVSEESPVPPPPPPLNDTTPPVLNAGADRNVTAGVLAQFNGTAADNDANFTQTAEFWWTFSYNGTNYNVTGQNFSYTFWVVGTVAVRFGGRDASWNEANDTMQLAVVSPDTQAPTVSAGPNLTVAAGVPLHLIGEATDNDPGFLLGAQFFWRFTYNGSQITTPSQEVTFTFWTLGNYTLTFSAVDPWRNAAADSVTITVEKPDTIPPSATAFVGGSALAGGLTWLNGSVNDNDPNLLTLGHFDWTFTYNGTQRTLTGLNVNFTFWVPGTYEARFTATDPWGNRNESVVQVVILRPDSEPPAAEAGTFGEVLEGTTVNFAGSALDNDPAWPTGASFWWIVDYRGTEFNLTGRNASFQFNDAGNYSVTFWARDAWGNVGNDTRIITVVAAAPPPGANDVPRPGAESFLLPGILVALVAAAAIGVVALRRRAGSSGAEAGGAAPAGDNGAAAARTAYVLEGVMVLYRDGRLVHDVRGGAAAQLESPEVFGSMVAAVAAFIRDSFREEGSLSRLTYGKNTIILEHGHHFFLAAIAYGEPDDLLRDQLRDTVRRLESAYTGVVESWTGEKDAFLGIEALLMPLFAATSSLTRDNVREAVAQKGVKVLSGTEHYRGYVRLKVAVVNYTNETITDATVKVDFNRTALLLARVEPVTLEREGTSVKLGAVAPGERVGAIYYLDPQMCNQTNIEGRATYRDGKGESHEVAMKTREAEIVCPIFFTPDHANAAMLKRLVETSLPSRDSKIYRIPNPPNRVTFKALFLYASEIVRRYDVKPVRSQTAPTPFAGRAWFYGMQKVAKTPVVIRVFVSEDRGAVEFLVAAEQASAVAGLLAEIHRSFLEMLKTRLPRLTIEPVLDETLKGLLSPDEFVPPEGEAGPI